MGILISKRHPVISKLRNPAKVSKSPSLSNSSDLSQTMRRKFDVVSASSQHFTLTIPSPKTLSLQPCSSLIVLISPFIYRLLLSYLLLYPRSPRLFPRLTLSHARSRNRLRVAISRIHKNVRSRIYQLLLIYSSV